MLSSSGCCRCGEREDVEEPLVPERRREGRERGRLGGVRDVARVEVAREERGAEEEHHGEADREQDVEQEQDGEQIREPRVAERMVVEADEEARCAEHEREIALGA